MQGSGMWRKAMMRHWQLFRNSSGTSTSTSTSTSRTVLGVRVPNPRKAEIDFDDGRKFQFSAEFLRVYSPAADSKRRIVTGDRKVVSGRRHVGIMSVDSVGNYGIRITFDDLHNTGIYTWNYLYHLGDNKFSLMREYIKSLREHGLSRDPRVQTITK